MLLVLLLASPALGSLMSEPPPPLQRRPASPVHAWVPVRLNHFDASNTDTFLLRYYYNDQFATNNNIVIVVGGPWEISPGWVTGGLAYELAENIGAGLFYIEHRYYGLSRPTNGTSVPELRYLTVSQALEDLVQFIQYVRSDVFESGRFRDGKVALAGCGYAGSIATWMRHAYPHIVSAAFSDSGPLLAVDDFAEYLAMVWEVLRTEGSDECVATLDNAMERLNAEIITQEGADRVADMFNTCSRFEVQNPLDAGTFFWRGVLEPLSRLVQFAVPGDIAKACEVLTDPNILEPTERLARWLRSQPSTQPCIQANFTAHVEAHTNTSYDAPQSPDRLWMYQSCVEFGWHKTTASFYTFGNAVPLPYIRALCRQYFTEDFDDSLQWEGIRNINTKYGGLGNMPDGVVSVAGALDPWSSLVANRTHATFLSPVYIISGGSQCRAFGSTGESETHLEEAVKQAVLLNMQQLVSGQPPHHVPGLGAASATTPVVFTIIITTLALIL